MSLASCGRVGKQTSGGMGEDMLAELKFLVLASQSILTMLQECFLVDQDLGTVCVCTCGLRQEQQTWPTPSWQAAHSSNVCGKPSALWDQGIIGRTKGLDAGWSAG